MMSAVKRILKINPALPEESFQCSLSSLLPGSLCLVSPEQRLNQKILIYPNRRLAAFFDCRLAYKWTNWKMSTTCSCCRCLYHASPVEVPCEEGDTSARYAGRSRDQLDRCRPRKV